MHHETPDGSTPSPEAVMDQPRSLPEFHLLSSEERGAFAQAVMQDPTLHPLILSVLKNWQERNPENPPQKVPNVNRAFLVLGAKVVLEHVKTQRAKEFATLMAALKLVRLKGQGGAELTENEKNDLGLLADLEKGTLQNSSLSQLMNRMSISSGDAQFMLVRHLIQLPDSQGGLRTASYVKATDAMLSIATDLHKKTHARIEWDKFKGEDLKAGDILIIGKEPQVLRRQKSGLYAAKDSKTEVSAMDLGELQTQGMVAGVSAHMVTPYDMEQLRKKP